MKTLKSCIISILVTGITSILITLVTIVAFVILLQTQCGRDDEPTDEEMIQLFNRHEAAFNAIREIAAKYESFTYPKQYERDSSYLMLSADEREKLDELLDEINAIRVSHNRYPQWPFSEQPAREETRVEYYSWGLSVTGGYKDFVYKPNFTEEMKYYNSEVAKDRESEKFMVKRVTTGDLRELDGTFATQDTELYRPIRNHWYICLERVN